MKPMQNYMTSNFQSQMDPLLVVNLIRIVNALFGDYPYDMLIFEPDKEGCLQVRLAGYHFETDHLDEETVILETKIKLERVFWWKVDYYGDHYVGNFLFPEDW